MENEQYEGWRETSRQKLGPQELAITKQAVVEKSEFGLTVCFFLTTGGSLFIPLSKTMDNTIGDNLDLEKIYIITLSKKNEDDIIRIGY